MKKIAIVCLGAIAVSSAIAEPAQSQYVNWKESGVPTFVFRSGSGLTPGTEVTYTLSSEERNSAVGTANACGYKILSPGSSSTGISSVHPSAGSIIPTATLPLFDGSCKASAGGNALVPTTAGAAVPTSHYKLADGKVAIKVEPGWTYLTVTKDQVQKKTKAGKCGEVKYSVQSAKAGERQPFWASTITIPGVTSGAVDLENVSQNNQDAICSQRWVENTGTGLMEKVAKFFTL